MIPAEGQGVPNLLKEGKERRSDTNSIALQNLPSFPHFGGLPMDLRVAMDLDIGKEIVILGCVYATPEIDYITTKTLLRIPLSIFHPQASRIILPVLKNKGEWAEELVIK